MDNKSINIKVGLDSLSKNYSGTIFGEIYLSIDEYFFPEKDWNDFVVVLLNWWGNAVYNLSNSRNGAIQQLEFMEGPLLVRCTKISNDTAEFHFIKKRKSSERVFYICKSSISELKKSLSITSKTLLKELRTKGWKSDDVKQLENTLKILED